MSALLKNREWQNLDESVRYANYIGLKAEKMDLFRAYTQLGYPLRLSGIIGVILHLPTEISYPSSVKKSEITDYECWIPGIDGDISDALSIEELAPYQFQGNYNLTSYVCVSRPFTRSDGTQSLLPYRIYAEGPIVRHPVAQSLVALNWHDILEGHLGDALQLNREQIESMGPDTHETDTTNWPLIAGALLMLLTEDGKRNQSSISTAIDELGIHGLKKRTVDGALAKANKAFGEKR